MEKKHILCMGEAAIDFLSSERDTPLQEARHFTRQISGEAALAILIARHGVPVAFLGKVGNDRFGEALLDQLQQNGVDTSAVSVDEGNETTVTCTSLKANGEICEKNYLTRGADRFLQEKEVELRVLRDVSLLHFSSYGLFTDSDHFTNSILSWCGKLGIRVSFRLRGELSLRREDVRKRVQHLLKQVDILFLEEEQAVYLTGLISHDFAAERLFQLYGLQQVLMRQGDEIVLYTSEGELFRSYLDPGKERAFLAAYLSSLQEKDSHKALAFYAALSCVYSNE